MKGLWQRWVTLWDTQEAPQVLGTVRLGVATVLLADLVSIGVRGLVPVLWAPQEAGGIPTVLQRDVVPWAWQLLPPTAQSAWCLWGVLLLAALALLIGWRSRTAALVLLLVSAQTAQTTPLADRGIDMLLRNVLLILACSGAGRAWSWQAWRETGRFAGSSDTRIPGWPRHLLVLQLLVMYLTAGLQKTGLPWTPMGDFSALYIVLKDPSIAAGPLPWLESLYPLTQVGTALTVLFELSALGVCGVYWLRWTHDRPGRLRAWVVRRRPHLAWLGLGVVFHLGIAATMALGIFPWAILALYPAFLHPDEAQDMTQRLRALRPG